MFKYNINKKLLPMKAHYFLFNAGTAPVVPFMSTYAKQLGFSSVVVGVIYTILPFSGMLAKPIMGAIADRYKCQKIIFLIAQFVAALMYLSMVFLPEVPKNAKMNFECNISGVALNTCFEQIESCTAFRLKNDLRDSTAICKLSCPFTPANLDTISNHWGDAQDWTPHLDYFEFSALVPTKTIDQIGNCIYFYVNNATLQNEVVFYPTCPRNDSIASVCDVKCDSYILNELLNESAVKDGEVFKIPVFWILLSVYLIAWLGQAVTISVSDTICFQILDDKPNRYGYQRMYGALGWGIFSIASGFLVDFFSKGRVAKNYGPVFCIGVGILLLCIIVSSQIQDTQQQSSQRIIKDIRHLLCNPHILIFMLWCMCVGLCTSLMWNFLFWLLEDLASHHGCDMQNWIKTIEGLVMGIHCLAGELPFFFLSSWILKRLGHVHTMSLVLLVIGIRFIFYSVITNPWQCLPIELLNGITFGLFYATMTSYASIVAPPGAETTTQGLVGAVFEGVGISTGSFLGGILFHIYGGAKTFRIYGICSIVACVLHAVVQYFITKNSYVKDSPVKYSTPQDAIRIVNNNTGEPLTAVY